MYVMPGDWLGLINDLLTYLFNYLWKKKWRPAHVTATIPVTASSNLEGNMVDIGLLTAVIILLVKCDVDLQFQGQLLRLLCCQPQLHHFGESLVNIGGIIDEMQMFFVNGDFDGHFQRQQIWRFVADRDALIVVVIFLNRSKKSPDISKIAKRYMTLINHVKVIPVFLV